MRLFRWFIVRQLRREPARSLSTVVGVALGIAVVLAIRLANDSSVRGFERALDAVSGRTSLEVVGPGVGVPEDRLAELGWLREVGRVSPVIDGDAVLRGPAAGPGEGELVRILGVDILRDQPFRDYRLLADEAAVTVTTQQFLDILTDRQAIVLTQALADRQGLTLDSEVALVSGDTVVPLIVRGLLDAEGPAQVQGGNFALMDIAAAQLALGRLGSVDRIDIQLPEGVDVAERLAAVAERLPPGLGVQRPERRGAQVEKMLAAFQFNLEALSYIALLVGIFLVYNTVSVSVIARRAEIGMLRTVGASRGTVLRLFLGEALGLAAVGCALGAPLGWLLARGAVGFTSSTVSTFWVAAAATVPDLTATDVGLAFVIGLPLAIAAAVVPAREAAGLEPVAAVRGQTDVDTRLRPPWRYGVAALLLFAAGGGLATLPAVDGLPVFGLLASLLVVFGAAATVPLVLHGAQQAPPWLDRWLRVEGVLARSRVGASVRRVAISVAALAVSLSMMVAIAVMIGSFRETVIYWVGQTLQADLFVASGRSGPVGTRASISETVEATIRAHPDVEAVDGFRSADVPYGESLVIVGSGRFDVLLEHGNLLFKSAGGREAMAASTDRDRVVVSESFSLRYDAGPGDTIELETAAGPWPFEVVAVYYDYSSDRGLVVMDESRFDHHYDRRRPSGLTVYLREGTDADAVRRALADTIGADRPVFINTNASLRRQVLEVFDSTFAITYALEGIAIVVSMLGVAATLLTLALERRRETMVLRLVGAERRHLRRIIMIEALLLGGVSLVIGLAVGLVLSLILIFVINVQSFGWTIQFHVPVGFLAQTAVLLLAATALAGLYPARLALRLTLADVGREAR